MPSAPMMPRTAAPHDLLAAALHVLPHAYAPYSRFHVAAAIRFEDGSIVAGTNCENASYGLTMCAERSAIFHAASRGLRRATECLVLTPTSTPVTPCGACRQVLREFAPRPADLVCWSVCETGVRRWTLEELLPESFGPEALGDTPQA